MHSLRSLEILEKKEAVFNLEGKRQRKFSYQILNYHQIYDNQEGIRPIDINDFAIDVQNQQDSPIKFLWITCRNLLSQSSNTEELKVALASMELIVTAEHFLTETVQYSDLVLPATMLFEKWEIVASYWHHWVSINQPAIEPYYESKSDLEVARLLSRRLNKYKEGFSAFPTDLTDEEFIEQEFTQEFNDKLDIYNWRELLNGPQKEDLPKTAWEDLRFKTPSGKIELYSKVAKNNGLSPFGLELMGNWVDNEYPYSLFINS